MNKRAAEAWAMAKASMTAGQFEVWVRRDINEERITDIAQGLGVSYQAVQARLRLARKNLGRAIDERKAA